LFARVLNVQWSALGGGSVEVEKKAPRWRMGPVNADRMQPDTLAKNTPPKVQLGSRPNSGLPIVSALALRRLGAFLLLVGY